MTHLMMIDDGLDDGVTARRQEARRQDPAIMLVRAALLRRSCDVVAAATQLRRPGSVALILRVASMRSQHHFPSC